VRNLIRRPLAVGLLAGLGTMAVAPAAFASTTIEAYGIHATGLVSVVKQPDATLSTPSPSNVASATVGLLLTTGMLHAAVTQGAGTEQATATVASVGSPALTGLGLTTGVITTTCTATSGSNTTGTVNIVNLNWGSTTLNGNISPNTSFTIPGVASVVVNGQAPAGPGTGDLAVNAIHITVLGGSAQDIVIGHAECGPAPSASGAPLASGAGLNLGLGLLSCGGLTAGLMWLRRLRTSHPARPA
jgi:hypothetical protein